MRPVIAAYRNELVAGVLLAAARVSGRFSMKILAGFLGKDCTVVTPRASAGYRAPS
jgi:hypothetical protein